MKHERYLAEGETLPYIKEHGRCAITRQPFTKGDAIAAVLLPVKADWPLPVWDDYPMGTDAKAVAYVLQAAVPAGGVPHHQIIEATQCDGLSIAFHPITFSNEEANETAILQEV